MRVRFTLTGSMRLAVLPETSLGSSLAPILSVLGHPPDMVDRLVALLHRGMTFDFLFTTGLVKLVSASVLEPVLELHKLSLRTRPLGSPFYYTP